MNIWSDPFNEQVAVKAFSATTVQKMAKEVEESESELQGKG